MQYTRIVQINIRITSICNYKRRMNICLHILASFEFEKKRKNKISIVDKKMFQVLKQKLTLRN